MYTFIDHRPQAVRYTLICHARKNIVFTTQVEENTLWTVTMSKRVTLLHAYSRQWRGAEENGREAAVERVGR